MGRDEEEKNGEHPCRMNFMQTIVCRISLVDISFDPLFLFSFGQFEL
jgi:hypothetical protein